MLHTQDLWQEHWAAIIESKFSLIAAQLIHEEMDVATTRRDQKAYTKRHLRHIRASEKHLRKAKRVRRKIARYEEKYARLHQSDHSNE